MSISYLPVTKTNVPGKQSVAHLQATFTAKLAELRAHADEQRFAWVLDIDGRYSGQTPSDQDAHQRLQYAIDAIDAANHRILTAFDTLADNRD
jgi:hypothetical protein